MRKSHSHVSAARADRDAVTAYVCSRHLGFLAFVARIRWYRKRKPATGQYTLPYPGEDGRGFSPPRAPPVASDPVPGPCPGRPSCRPQAGLTLAQD